MVQAAFLYGPRDIRIEEMPDEAPGPGEVLLDVAAVGICGSDLHNYLNGEIGGTVVAGPLVLGHEAAGRVAALGPGLEARFQVGQLVAIDPAIHCGECERCQSGQQHLCTHLQFMGLFPRHGALRTRMVHPAEQCIALPPGVDAVSAALLEPLGVALHAIRLAKIALNDDVLIIGCGAIGLLLVQLARLSGARRIFVSDRHVWRLEAARSFGADHLLNANDGDVVQFVHDATGQRGVDVAIESAWVKDTANQCVEAARNGGHVVVVGIPAEDSITLRASPARRKEISLDLSRRMNQTYPACIDLLSRGKVALHALATHRFPLSQTAAALETAATYREGVVRAMVLPTEPE
ncbi:MAG TPA: alcohol dehydrogenase catalytic domain-containing protein [Chloroflexota bacterium]|jgi:L-iditol 2-dehydrogenase